MCVSKRTHLLKCFLYNKQQNICVYRNGKKIKETYPLIGDLHTTNKSRNTLKSQVIFGLKLFTVFVGHSFSANFLSENGRKKINDFEFRLKNLEKTNRQETSWNKKLKLVWGPFK